MTSHKSLILFLKLLILRQAISGFLRYFNLASLSFSRSGDFSSVLSLLKEVSTLPSGAHWDEMCVALKNSYLH